MKLCWAFDVNTGRRADKAARCGGVLSDQTKQKRASWILHQHSKIVPGDSLVHTEKYTGRQTFFFFVIVVILEKESKIQQEPLCSVY